jgi:hypothetical protein
MEAAAATAMAPTAAAAELAKSLPVDQAVLLAALIAHDLQHPIPGNKPKKKCPSNSSPSNDPNNNPLLAGAKFPDTKEMAKLFNTDNDTFHRDTKQFIIKDNADAANKIGADNPTVGYDPDTGNIWFKNETTGETIDTLAQYLWYVEEE